MTNQNNTITIPNYKTLSIKHIVCDYNGTIAKSGQVLDGVLERFLVLGEQYMLHVITADTFGSVKTQLEGYGAEVKILSSSDHTQEKADYITHLEAEQTIAIGNGNNDVKMLKTAIMGIAIIGDEGCSTQAILSSDIVCKDINDALDLIIEPKGPIATLRR